MDASLPARCLLATTLLLAPSLAFPQTACPEQLPQPTSKLLYVENLGVLFTTRVAQRGLEDADDLLAARSIAAGQLKPLVRTGSLAIADGAILKLPDNARVALSDSTLNQLAQGLVGSTPMQLKLLDLQDFASNALPQRVVPPSLADSDERKRNPSQAGNEPSDDERLRRSSSLCTAQVIDRFVTTSRQVSEVLPTLASQQRWGDVPNELLRARRLPVPDNDPQHTRIKAFELAYRDLIEKCTSRTLPGDTAHMVGKLTVGNQTCTAVRLGKRYLATSRHCLFTESGTARQVSPLAISFSYAGVDQPLPVCGIVRNRQAGTDLIGKAISPNNDFVILVTLPWPDKVPLRSATPQQIRPGDGPLSELQVTSVWPGSAALGLADRDELRSYSGGFCQIAGPNNPTEAGCLLHKCGTIAGGSGAPLMVRQRSASPPGGSYLVAINRGEAGRFDDGGPCTERAVGVQANNVATIVPKEMLDELE
ncbi:hypothetical protein [Pseudomonas sp. RW3S2]|uniref:trypsin-like serine peptidase n=1 Tax=Pseudomonas sp. RW3S2 TaxID=485884 RepID=UPI00164520D0|nr:hypothetical protein [Pseudomonas sp. RW3S2]MBC3419635.1 hypothetical protein [Pseudomonas sp. RW3S2]